MAERSGVFAWLRGAALRIGLVGLLAGAACGPGATALHSLPGGPASDFYALPFPSDLRLRSDGTYDLSSYHRPPGQVGLYVQTLDQTARVPGAGPSAAIYFRFDAPIDPDSLPATPQASLSPDATAFVVDITPGSPTYGKQAPVLTHFSAAQGHYIGPNWLALRPFPGIPLRERTTYAAFLMSGLRAADGGAVRRDPDLNQLLTPNPPADATLHGYWTRFAPLRAYLQSHLTPDQVVGVTVFTTQDTTSLMQRLRKVTYDQAPNPVPAQLTYLQSHDGLCQIYVGTYQSPNFQSGQVPYLTSGGAITTDIAGDPLIDHIETLRFALSIPNAPMPAAGWPIVLYAHGTGGDYQSFIREQLDLRAALVEQDGQVLGRMAMIGIDQVLHGPRDPTHSDPDLTFFNLQNLIAARDNPRQGAADDFQLLRLVKNFNVPADPATGRPIRFDPKNIYFAGHSQGGLTGPLFLSAEPEIHGAVLSGAGAVLVLSLLNKSQPIDIAGLVGALLQETATPDHPLLNLLQTYFEPADPNNYGRLYFREPPPGFAPKSIFQTLGIVDHYAPVPNISALGLSMGVQPVAPSLYELPGLDLAGQAWGHLPVSGNVAGGQATGVLRQYPQYPQSDGHFVIFDQWAARDDWTRFLANAAHSGQFKLVQDSYNVVFGNN